jgi:hypothetical protein
VKETNCHVIVKKQGLEHYHTSSIFRNEQHSANRCHRKEKAMGLQKIKKSNNPMALG